MLTSGLRHELRRRWRTPFCARSVLDTKICGERLKALHESVSLERFRKQWVRTLLPFRMRRARG
jgi:carotenoid 1,2-hydratase